MRLFTQIKRVSTLAAWVLLPFAGANAQGYELDEPLDVTMNVRVKVEGNIQAIDTGIDVTCDIAFDGGVYQKVTKTVLAVGETFVPESDDGFIEVQIRLENVQPPPYYPDERGGPTRGELYYRCEAIRGDTNLSFLGFANRQHTAADPVDVGTCSIAGNYVYPQSETPPRDDVICAAIRQ